MCLFFILFLSQKNKYNLNIYLLFHPFFISMICIEKKERKSCLSTKEGALEKTAFFEQNYSGN